MKGKGNKKSKEYKEKGIRRRRRNIRKRNMKKKI
jgi:hypothetical protein